MSRTYDEVNVRWRCDVCLFEVPASPGAPRGGRSVPEGWEYLPHHEVVARLPSGARVTQHVGGDMCPACAARPFADILRDARRRAGGVA